MWLYHYKELSYMYIADLMYIHISTVRRIIGLYNQSGDVSPITYIRYHLYICGPQRMLQDVEKTSLLESLMANPAMYLDELQQELFVNTGTWASISTVFRTIRRWDLHAKNYGT